MAAGRASALLVLATLTLCLTSENKNVNNSRTNWNTTTQAQQLTQEIKEKYEPCKHTSITCKNGTFCCTNQIHTVCCSHSHGKEAQPWQRFEYIVPSFVILVAIVLAAIMCLRKN